MGNKLKSIATPKVPKNLRNRTSLGLIYEVLHCTIVPTVISYYTCQRDPWDQQASVICNEIWVILTSAGGMDFEVDPRGPIYKIVSQLYNHYYYYYSFKLLGHSTLICLGHNKDLWSWRSKYKSYGALRGCDLGVRDCLQVYCGK